MEDPTEFLDLPGLQVNYLSCFVVDSYGTAGDGVRVGQLGAVAPLLSVQLIRPLGAAKTTGLSVPVEGI